MVVDSAGLRCAFLASTVSVVMMQRSRFGVQVWVSFGGLLWSCGLVGCFPGGVSGRALVVLFGVLYFVGLLGFCVVSCVVCLWVWRCGLVFGCVGTVLFASWILFACGFCLLFVIAVFAMWFVAV